MKPTIFFAILLSTRLLLAAAPVAIDFAAGEPADYFTDDTAGRVQIATASGAKCQVIASATAHCRPYPVEPATRYTLRLDAAFTGDAESIEENPRFEIFTQLGKTSPRLPSRVIRFFDADGQPAGQPLVYAMPFKERHTYQDEFYTPPNAASVRIDLASGSDIRLELSKLKLQQSAPDEALNVNPEFKLGPLNYSGWQNISSGGQLIERDGKVILDTKYGSTGQHIPLPGPGTYGFSAKATGNGYNSIVIIRIYDAAGKELMRSGSRQYGPLTYFVPPPEAVSASFLVYSCLLEEVRLVKVGDENAIETLRSK